MANRLPSDHASIETVRARIERHGGGYRLSVPRSVVPSDETVVRVVLEESVRFARLGRDGTEQRWITGVYGTSRGAREPDIGDDRLPAWLDRIGRDVGTSVELDVIESGERYGLREPGTRTVYAAPDSPADGLASIAADLTDEN